MLRLGARIGLVFLTAALAVPSSWAQASKPTAKRVRGKAAVKKVATPVPVPQLPPPPPPTLEQMPATPPQVTYQNGMLTIAAQNSTLADILAAVRARTGAAIEMPPGGAAERVVTRLGPAPPRDVLDSLLEGSRFNYLILSSEQQPDAVQRIVLTARPAGTATASNVQPGATQPGFRPGMTPPMQADEGDEEPVSGEGEDEPEPVQPEPVPQSQGQPGNPQPQAQPGQANPNVKTPEQLLQELQRMQQQQQQQQQQQSQQPGQPIRPNQVPPQQPPPNPPEQ